MINYITLRSAPLSLLLRLRFALRSAPLWCSLTVSLSYSLRRALNWSDFSELYVIDIVI
jgi:hypothetical protein